MITLTLTSNLIPTTNAILFSKKLNDILSDFQSIFEIFGKFCSVCRIFIKVFDPFIVENELQCKIRFEVHSGSMFENEEKLYRELDIVIFQLSKYKIKFDLLQHS